MARISRRTSAGCGRGVDRSVKRSDQTVDVNGRAGIGQRPLRKPTPRDVLVRHHLDPLVSRVTADALHQFVHTGARSFKDLREAIPRRDDAPVM